MNINNIIVYFVSVIFIPIVKGAVPGTFFWRPRVGIEIYDPKYTTTPSPTTVDEKDIDKSNIVLLQGFSVAKSFNIFTDSISVAARYEYQSPLSAAYYNNVYRWTLRCLERLPQWFQLNSHYVDTQKVWENRYEHLDAFVPKWLRPLLFFVKQSDWKSDEERHRRYKKYAEDVFSTHYVYHVNFADRRASKGLKSVAATNLSFTIPGG